MQTIFGIFLMLHGIVFGLYAGHAFKLYEMSPGMMWPDNSWAFTNIFGTDGTRALAGITYLLTALGFTIGGIGLLVMKEWWNPVIVVATAVSSMFIILLWDGKLLNLHDKGAVGLVINLVLLAIILILHWPANV